MCLEANTDPGAALISSKMKKNITFGQNIATLERSKMAAYLEITTLAAATPLNMQLAELADAMNEAKSINVHTILPARGKIIFTTEKGASNSDVICTVCDAITRVFNIVPIVSNERAKEIV